MKYFVHIILRTYLLYIPVPTWFPMTAARQQAACVRVCACVRPFSSHPFRTPIYTFRLKRGLTSPGHTDTHSTKVITEKDFSCFFLRVSFCSASKGPIALSPRRLFFQSILKLQLPAKQITFHSPIKPRYCVKLLFLQASLSKGSTPASGWPGTTASWSLPWSPSPRTSWKRPWVSFTSL